MLTWDDFGELVETSVAARFEAVAAALPGQPALIGGAEGVLTYGDLEQRTRRGAAALIERLGAGGDVVAVLLPHGPGAVSTTLSVFRAGKVLLSLDPAAGIARNLAILHEARAAVVVSDAAGRAELAAGEPEIALVDVDALEAEPSGSLPRRAPEDPAILLTTSGSSGASKCVVVSNAGQLFALHAVGRAVDMGPGDCGSSLFSMAFTGGVTMGHMPLVRGAAVWAADLRSLGLGGTVQGIAQHRVSHLMLVPSVLRALTGVAAPQALETVRMVLAGGEAMTPEDVRRARRVFAPRCVFVQVMASTEAGPVGFTRIEPEDQPADAAMGLRPFEGLDVRVTDPDGAPVPAGETGEIVVRGRHTPSGFIGKGDDERFTDHGDGMISIRTGDLGRFDALGELHVLGRSDDRVKIRGQSVELDSVEAAVRELSEVAAAAVCAVEIGKATVLVACIVAAGGHVAPDADSLRRRIGRQLAAAAVPTVVITAPALPTLPNGKTDRAAVAAFARTALSPEA